MNLFFKCLSVKWLCGYTSVCLNFRTITSWLSLIYSLSSSYLLYPFLQLNCKLCFLASVNSVLHLQEWHSFQSADLERTHTHTPPTFYSVGDNLSGIGIWMFCWREKPRHIFWVGPFSILKGKVHINFTVLCVSHNFHKGKLRQFALINNCLEINFVSFKHSVCDAIH